MSYPTGHRGSVEKRFWQKVDKREPNECWLWTASLRNGRYGQFFDGKDVRYAHRFAYEIVHGPIPQGMRVCHRCDVPQCVNPSHLFLGTEQDNKADMARKGRSCLGEHNAMAKLTFEQAEQIRVLAAQGTIYQRVIAAQFGVSQTTVYRIKHGAWSRRRAI